MKILYIFGVFVLFSTFETKAGDVNIDELTTQVEYFNCTAMADGNYEHPERCGGQYITCHDKKAFERNCPLCKTCLDGGRLYYLASLDTCVEADKAGCGKPPTTTTTTTTTPRPVSPEGPCPQECQQEGDCIWYFRCEGSTFNQDKQIYEGIWVNNTCPQSPEELFWNPTPGVGSGGQCVRFTDLSKERQTLYKKDPLCFCPCYWEEHETKEGRCQGKYYYWNRVTPNSHGLEKQVLNCPLGLVFNKNIETCDNCRNVRSGECC